MTLFLALMLSGLLLTVWLSAVSAHDLKVSFPITQRNPLSNSKKIVPGSMGFPANRTDPISATLLAPESTYELEIEKSKSPQTFTVGANNSYTLYVARLNADPVYAGFSVEDDLPAGMTWTPSATIGRWDCTASTPHSLRCFYTQGVSGADLIDTIYFKVNVAPDIQDHVTNTAYLYYRSIVKSSTIETAISSADLVLSKQLAPLPVLTVNSLISYTLTITNNGPSVANNVVVIESLPTELQPYTTTNLIPSINPTRGSFNPGTNIWTIGNMNRDEIQKLVLWTRPKSTVNGKTVTNQARASTTNHDWNLSNNVASKSFIVGGVEISKSYFPSNTSLYVGDIFSFTVAITNGNSYPISQIQVKDTFTNTLDIVECRIYFFSPAYTQLCNISNRDLSTYINLVAGQHANIVIRVRGNKNIGTTAFTFTNHASATWGSPSFTLNSNEVEVSIFPGGSLQVGKTDNATQVERSQFVTYTVSITNAGSLAISPGTLVVTDTFLANLAFYSINKNNLVMNEIYSPGNIRAWSIPNVALAPGQVISFTITAYVFSPVEGSNVINQVDVSAKDINNRTLHATSNDIDTIPTTVLTIDKAVSNPTAFAGETFYYTITLQNVGFSIVGADVSDDLSSYLDVTSCRLLYFDNLADNCYIYNHTLYTYIFLHPFQTAKIVIAVRGNPTIGNMFKNISNTASLHWGYPGTTLTSNEVDVTILPGVFLQVGKSDGVDSVIQGQSNFYTIDITNIGSLPIPANTLRVTDTFLSNVSYLSIDPNGLDIEPVYNTGNVRSWDIRNIWLMPGEKISFYIGVHVSSSPVSNTATNLVTAIAKDNTNRQLPVVSAIDEDEILGVGRRIFFPLIRVYSNNPTPTPTPTQGPYPPPATTEPAAATETPAPPPTAIPFGVYINNIFYRGTGTGESDEYVEIRNSGYSAINLLNWWISEENEFSYFDFGQVTLGAGQSCRIYTNQSTGINWCGNFESTTPVWDNTSDCGALYNANDETVSRYCYP
jgi:uncharacterized repeat protein (TIGR01451 family)